MVGSNQVRVENDTDYVMEIDQNTKDGNSKFGSLSTVSLETFSL